MKSFTRKVEVEEDLADVDYNINDPKDTYEAMAMAHYEDDDEDDEVKSKGEVVKHESHAFYDIIGNEFGTGDEKDEYKEDMGEYKVDVDQVVNEDEKEKPDEECKNRDSSSDDDYDPPKDDCDSPSPNPNLLKPRKTRGRPPKQITKACSYTRQKRVKKLRVTFKEWCVQLGCEVNELNGILLYLDNICAKCSKQKLSKRDNICTEGANPELAKIGWEITHSKLCSDMRQHKVEEVRATFQEWSTKLECTTDQLNGLFLYLNNYTKKQKLALIGRKIFKEEPIQIAKDDGDGTKVIERVALNDRTQKAEEEPKFMCTLCGKKLMTQRKLLAHEREHGGTIDTCDICGKGFTMVNALAIHKAQMHKKNANPEEIHCCDKCGKQYGNKGSLDRHIKNVHGEPIKCKHCEFSTSSKTVFARHQETHGDPKYKCSICGKMFRDRSIPQLARLAAKRLPPHINDCKALYLHCDEQHLTANLSS